ncbi:PIN domain-containing protein [Amycolatopsis marina]|uniref:PIN domain-containing protein n=1 Tax=Amycolatopsis marina TaxID=490629 RepID=A0A1I0W8B1_9PSEU|nr:PIN domain-containing protein [Amycolatopsis marina]SFA84979.1 PIN domain-containing protein [Amycolatopsis marina]
MSAQRVLVDANVLFSRTLRDWLALIYINPGGEVYNVYWTEDILAEAVYQLRRNHPSWDGRQTRAIRDTIARTFEGGRVEDFVVDGSFQGTDPHDQHVHAAALACDADILLTCDGGFSGGPVNPDLLPYEVYTPDDFFVLVDKSVPEIVCAVTLEQTEYWRRKKQGKAPLAEHLEAAGCPQFAKRVRTYQGHLSIRGDR